MAPLVVIIGWFFSLVYLYQPGEIDGDLLNLTVMEIIASPFLIYIFWASFFISFTGSLVSLSFPGFQDMFAKRFTRVLSYDLPNITHCPSWYSTTYIQGKTATNS